MNLISSLSMGDKYNEFLIGLYPLHVWKDIEFFLGVLVALGCFLQLRWDDKIAWRSNGWAIFGRLGAIFQCVVALMTAFDAWVPVGIPRALALSWATSTLLFQVSALGPKISSGVYAGFMRILNAARRLRVARQPELSRHESVARSRRK